MYSELFSMSPSSSRLFPYNTFVRFTLSMLFSLPPHLHSFHFLRTLRPRDCRDSIVKRKTAVYIKQKSLLMLFSSCVCSRLLLQGFQIKQMIFFHSKRVSAMRNIIQNGLFVIQKKKRKNVYTFFIFLVLSSSAFTSEAHSC